MLRVGLTGGLGSGKSTAARMFAAKGAYVFSADEIGRELMQPGQAVYAAIVAKFGPGVVKADGSLDRPALARIAFGGGRIEELNAIVHPATIARQAELIAEVAARDPDAVAMVESALIFETKYGGEDGWQKALRPDCLCAGAGGGKDCPICGAIGGRAGLGQRGSGRRWRRRRGGGWRTRRKQNGTRRHAISYW